MPPTSTPRGSAVAPSRLSTAYLRSKPVPMASPVNDADMTASAMMLGTTKSIRRGDAEGVEQRQVEEEQQQQRDDERQPDLLGVAQLQPELQRGLRGEHRPGRRGARCRDERRASCPQLASGQVEEDVLEAAPLDGEVLGEHALARAPGGERGEQLRRRRRR